MSEKNRVLKQKDPKKNNLENKLNWYVSHEFVFLAIIIIIGLIIRMSYFPYDIPFTLDIMDQFAYAVKTSQLHDFPNGWALANNGWPGFVSIFFSFVKSDNIFDYIYLQRVLTIIISTVTVVPVYLLCRRFFERPFALFGAILFVFEPRIIENSLFGGTMVPYIFLGTVTMFLFLSDNRKIVYCSFITAALFSLVRFEGLLLIIPLSILFFYRYRKERRVILHYLIALSIFLSIILPMSYVQIENTGQDGLTSNIIRGTEYVSVHVIEGKPTVEDWIDTVPENKLYHFIMKGESNLLFYLGWASFPLFFVFLPYGIFFIFKDKNFKRFTIILVTIFFFIPIFYAYANDFQELRYLFVVYPIGSLVSIFLVEKIGMKIKKPNMLLIVLTCVIITASLTFLDNTKTDYQYEEDVYKISQFVVDTAQGVNAFYPESKYLKSAEIAKNWPIIPEPDESGHVTRNIQRISTDSFDSLDEFINKSKNMNLTHLVVDDKEDRVSFLNDVYLNDKKYPFLIKIYDSSEHGSSYNVKIYKIDYELFKKI